MMSSSLSISCITGESTGAGVVLGIGISMFWEIDGYSVEVVGVGASGAFLFGEGVTSLFLFLSTGVYDGGEEGRGWLLIVGF